jgi:hypothetical protein
MIRDDPMHWGNRRKIPGLPQESAEISAESWPYDGG